MGCGMGRARHSPARIVVVGAEAVGDCRQGTYLLRIGVPEALHVAFGRFGGGEPIRVPAGGYVYVGSARAPRGAASLPHRIVRHATRSDCKPPHRIRDEVMQAYGVPAPARKRLFWNVDHLLDQIGVEIEAVLVVPGAAPREAAISRILSHDARTAPLAKGLGAHDDPGRTHLLRVTGDETWWRELPGQLSRYLADRVIA